MLSIGVEGLGLEEEAESTLAKIWTAIKNFVQRIISSVKRFMLSIFSGTKGLKTKLAVLKAEAAKVTDKSEAKINGSDLHVLSYEHSVKPADIIRGVGIQAHCLDNSSKWAVRISDGIVDIINTISNDLTKDDTQALFTKYKTAVIELVEESVKGAELFAVNIEKILTGGDGFEIHIPGEVYVKVSGLAAAKVWLEHISKVKQDDATLAGGFLSFPIPTVTVHKDSKQAPTAEISALTKFS